MDLPWNDDEDYEETMDLPKKRNLFLEPSIDSRISRCPALEPTTHHQLTFKYSRVKIINLGGQWTQIQKFGGQKYNNLGGQKN